MALPTAYLTSTKNIEAIFNAIQSAKAPPKFTQRFLEDLGFQGAADRLIINMLKTLGFLSPDGSPTQRYFEFLDQSQAGRVLAQSLEDAYADLYQLNRNAHALPRQDLIGKIKTLTQGQASDAVVGKMATTFTSLAGLADFRAAQAAPQNGGVVTETAPERASDADGASPPEAGSDQPLPLRSAGVTLGGLVYNIELHLPDSRDPAVYEALFRSLKTHLLS
jgi:hypothetical protein